MGRRSQGGAAIPGTETPKKRTFTLGRLLAALIVVALVAIALFYGAGGWYYSAQIRDDVFVVHPPSTSYELTVSAVLDDAVTLQGSDNDIASEGRYGLDWPAGYAQVDDVVTFSEDGSTITATRVYLPSEDSLPTGTAVRLDTYAYTGTPEDAFVYPYRDVEYPSSVGQLGAWWVPGGTDTWVIAVHGRTGHRGEIFRMIPTFFDRSYHVLTIDYRNDPGRAQDPSGWYQYGLTEWEDVAAAAAFARENGARNLILYGHSMGGGAVLNFLAKSPLRNHTVAAILDSPVVQLEPVVDLGASQRTLIGDFAVPDSLTSVAKQLASWRFGINWDEYDFVEFWREYHAPMLIIHGTGDETVPVETSRRLEAQRPDIVTLVTPSGVGHTRGWNVDPAGYEATVAEFIDSLGV